MPRCALQLVVLLLVNSVVAMGYSHSQLHTCHFDDIHKNDEQNIRTVYQLNRRQPTDLTKKYIRVNFSTVDLDDVEKHCAQLGSRIKNLEGVYVHCDREDVLSTWKKQNLMKIVRSGIAMHTERLKVLPLNDQGFKVPYLSGALCQLFTVPAKHKSVGVRKTDFMLYVASFPSTRQDMLAAGAPCAKIDDGRPVAGVLTYVPREIALSVFHARVAAHEIAHALGFTYKIMKERIGSLMLNSHVRYKTVEEIHSPTVKKFSNIQYNCDRQWGVELEDENGVLSVRSKSHWERRNVLDELMVGVVTAGYYTYLTLALFHDLGFYEADFSKAEAMEWGKGLGCNFLNARCFENNNAMFPSHFCNTMQTNADTCGSGRRIVGHCSFPSQIYSPEAKYMYMWEYKVFWYDYFTGEPELLTDRCPIIDTGYTESCQNSKAHVEGTKGNDSWCMRKRARGTQNIVGAACGKMTVGNDGDVYAETYKTNERNSCRKQGDLFVVNVEHNGQEYTLECPSKEEIIQAKNMEDILQNASPANESGILPEKKYDRW